MNGHGGILPKQQGGQICFKRKSERIRPESGASPLSRSRGGELLFGDQAETQECSLGFFAAQLHFRSSEAMLSSVK
jgi:hypothetical protein